MGKKKIKFKANLLIDEKGQYHLRAIDKFAEAFTKSAAYNNISFSRVLRQFKDDSVVTITIEGVGNES